MSADGREKAIQNLISAIKNRKEKETQRAAQRSDTDVYYEIDSRIKRMGLKLIDYLQNPLTTKNLELIQDFIDSGVITYFVENPSAKGDAVREVRTSCITYWTTLEPNHIAILKRNHEASPPS